MRKASRPGGALLCISLVIAGCAGDDDSADRAPATTVPTADSTSTSAVSDTTTTTTTMTTTTTTTTTSPATTTTEQPTTTQRATTTTVDPAAEADLQALFLLDGIESGDAADVILGIVDIIEPFPLDRVDVITADLEAMNIVIVATSGYSTGEYQQDAAVDAVARLSNIWDVAALAGLGSIKVGLDLTVDDRRYVVSNESMRDVMNRRMTPQAALGL